MLNINSLVKRMKNRLPSPVFNAVDKDFWIDILFEESLQLMSTYYPKIVKGITVSQDMAVEVIDNKGRVNGCCKYVVPLVDEMYPYIGISTFNYPRNYMSGGTYSNPGLVDAFAAKILSSAQMADVRYTANFEAPNIIEINPPPRMHIDFTVSMQRMMRLEEIKTGLHETFKSLYEADCKVALYYKFYTISEGGSFGGIELRDYVSNFQDYESKREEIIEELEADYYKNPDRFEEIFGYNSGYG